MMMTLSPRRRARLLTWAAKAAAAAWPEEKEPDRERERPSVARLSEILWKRVVDAETG